MMRSRFEIYARRPASVAGVLFALVVWSAGVAGSGTGPDAIPGRLFVEVVDTEGRGWGTLLDRLREEIVLELRSAGCLELDVELRPAEEDGSALLLSVGIGDVVEESDYSVALADRYARERSADDEAESMTARLRADIEFRLLTLPERLVVRSRHARPEVRKEGSLGADARDEARGAMRRQIAVRSRKLVCKGGSAALRRDLGRAREAR